ncbi:uncharacterized protein LOC122257991 [Penaeus japonicus]|uniref:uncharacterized protein LOC122257991 n=1 Tax=Penaeus japonicus TaxID=27405 RepID=UPI001C70DF4E|nr:uncharacterized protein LOC122257991 [Penaeus japonicus]
MKLLVISMLVVGAFAAPQGYSLTEPSGLGLSVSEGHISSEGIKGVGTGNLLAASVSTSIESSESDIDVEFPSIAGLAPDSESSSTGVVKATVSGTTSDGSVDCQAGEVRHVDGSCVVPEITRKVFVVSVPKQQQGRTEALPNLPPPRVEHNVLFVRLPEGGVGLEPIVVPPPRQENIIYVLSKQGDQAQRVIEVPAHPPTEPEIYFVNYDEGENPTLPGGVDLQTALGSAVAAGGQHLGSRAKDEDHSIDGVNTSTDLAVSGDFHSGFGVAEAGRDVFSDAAADNKGLYSAP